MSIEVVNEGWSGSKRKHEKGKKDKKHSHIEKKRRRHHDSTEDAPPSQKPKKKKVSHVKSVESQHIDTISPSDASTESPFWTESRSFYLPLPPIASLYPLQGFCAQHFSPLILTYYRPMKGVILAYENQRLERHPVADSSGQLSLALSRSVDEYAATFAWVTTDFLVYRPKPGMLVEGYVTVQNEGHLGLLCLNMFNASIVRERLPKGWRWQGAPAEATPSTALLNGPDDMETDLENGMANGDAGEAGAEEAPESDGYWETGRGKRVEGFLKFKVRDLIVSRPGDREKGFFGIEGTLLTEAEEQELAERMRSSVFCQ